LQCLQHENQRHYLREGHLAAAAAAYIRSSVDPYLASIQQGIADAEKAVHTVLAECPKARIVMAGYSQGAIAVHDAENYLAANRRAEFSHIAGTLLLGDPDRVPHTKVKMFGSSSAGAEGLRVRLGLVSPHDVPDPATTANIANANDIVGDFALRHLLHAGEAIQVHENYAVTKNGKTTYEPVLGDAANWVASKIGTAQTVPLPKSSWRPVGGATVTGHKGGVFKVVYDPTYWGGSLPRIMQDAPISSPATAG
jgi:Cutinase